MNWEAIGAIGEIVGAVAVVITLLYLASQTRQNTKATHAQATASVASEMEQCLLTIANDGYLAEAYHKAMKREDLSELESIRLGFWWGAFVRGTHSHLARIIHEGACGVEFWRGVDVEQHAERRFAAA